MKTASPSFLSRGLGAVVLSAVLVLLSGCLEQRFVWSPDGRRAVVLTEEGLRLSDVDGKLSAVQVPGVHRVAWLPDSSRLIAATFRDAGDWAEVERELTPVQKQLVESSAEAAWQRMQAGMPWSEARGELGDRHRALFVVYLRHRHGAAFLQKLLPNERDDLGKWQIPIVELKLAQVEGDKIVAGALLHRGLGRCLDIRLSPDGQAASFVVEVPMAEQDDTFALFVTPLAAPKSTELATLVAVFPDWSADSQSVTYIQAASTRGPAAVPVLGTVVTRRVRQADGTLVTEPKPTVVAGVVFSPLMRVRCLRDGRIVFNAHEIGLPFAASDSDEPSEQLFAIDPSRQVTLTRLIPRAQESKLPRRLAYFEVSPDERRILFGTYKGEVAVLTLATGEVETIQAAGEDLQGAAQWRNAEEFTYVRRSPVRDGELVIRKGKEERVLSTAWPNDLVQSIF